MGVLKTGARFHFGIRGDTGLKVKGKVKSKDKWA